MKVRRWKYVARIVTETVAAEKTLFLTLTLRKEMSEAVGYRLVQRFLKRLRKKQTVRYACVAELGGKGGRLHFHMLLHGSTSLTDKSVRKHWRGGISHTSVVQSGGAMTAARYGAKMARYATKGAGRFRFSQGYGSLALRVIYEKPMVASVLDAFPGARVVRVAGTRLPRELHADKPVVFEPYPDDLLLDAHRELQKLKAEGGRRGKRRGPPLKQDP